MASEKLSNRIASLDIDENKEMKHEFINLKSKDGKIFRVPRGNANISDLVFAAIEGEPDAEEVPLPSVKADVLTHIVEYMNKKKGDKTVVVVKPLKVTMEDSCPGGKWDAEFINKVAEDKSLLRAMVMASNYMAINSLLHLSCARVGLSLKGKSKEKMMEELDITKA
ncbi:MAG: hypothetical protein PHG66_04575 [Candidatus Colwellbacteria bacterium]|nr:hypothetical protein [Candidatus Colwellbacteria bacterium]